MVAFPAFLVPLNSGRVCQTTRSEVGERSPVSEKIGVHAGRRKQPGLAAGVCPPAWSLQPRKGWRRMLGGAGWVSLELLVLFFKSLPLHTSQKLPSLHARNSLPSNLWPGISSSGPVHLCRGLSSQNSFPSVISKCFICSHFSCLGIPEGRFCK